MSTPPWLAVVAAALIGGGVGGAVVHFAAPKNNAPAKTSASAEPAPSATSTADLEKRLDALERNVSTLKRKSAAAQALKEYASVMAKADGDGGAPNPHAMNPVVDAEDPVFDLAVRSVLDRVDWEKEEERRVNRATRRTARAQRQADYLTEQLGLTPSQRSEIEKILTERMEAFGRLRNPPDGGSRPLTRRDWREAGSKIRADAEKKMETVLDESQMEKYRELDQEERGRGRGRRGGRGAGF